MKISPTHPEINDDIKKCILAAQDTLEVLDSTWKFHILILLKLKNRRFNELSKSIRGISPKILSRELKELEANHLIKRVVYNLFPPHVDYSLTEHGMSLESVIISLKNWGDTHRKKFIK